MQSAIAISGLINGVVSIIFSLMIIVNNRRSIVNRTLFLLTMATALWSLSYWRWLSIYDDYNAALFWVRMLSIFSTVIPVFFSHWVISLLGDNRKKRFFLVLIYVLAAFFLSFSFSNLFVSRVAPINNFVFWPRAGALYTLYLFSIYILVFSYTMILLAVNYFRAVDVNRKIQLRYVLLGASLACLGGATNFFMWYDIPIPPIGNFLVILYVFIFTYAIVRYQLMNIKLILRRSLVYLFSFFSILIPAFIWQYFFYRFFPAYTMISYIVIFIFSLSVFSGLKKYYFRISNRYFFSSLYDVRDLVSNLNSALRSSLDIKQIFDSVSQILIQSFRSKAIGVVSYSKRRGLWTIVSNTGFKFESSREISLNYEILEVIFKQHNKPLIVKDIKEGPWSQFFSMVKFFDELGVEVITPVKIKEKLNSLLLFGPKESGDTYNSEDLKVLEAVSAEVAISMENAALYQRTKQFNLELKEKIEKATKQLQDQNVELQKVNKIKNDFISVTSHQLKTPLATTKLNLELFGLKFKTKVAPEAMEMVDNLTNINDQLIKLVEELLDVARIEDSRLKIDVEPLDIAAMVQSVVLTFKPLADKREIKIVEDYGAVPTIDFDRSILSKAVANLISNGIKYNREKKNLIIKLQGSDLGVKLSVADEGIGIPQAEQAKIFQKFYQATNAAKSNFESSTGLGMYITKSSIEQLGGKVWFESQENKGSTFFIELPLKAVVKQ